MKISKENKEKQKQAYIEALAAIEGEFPKRNEWYTLFDPEDPPDGFTKAQLRSNHAHMLPHRVFSREEIEDIVAKAVHKKIGNFGDKAASLLEELYRAGISGDTAAAKEFLNRVLGPVQQQVRFQADATDRLTDLLNRMLPSHAYARPNIDANGFEIIDVEPEELPEGMEEKQGDGEQAD